MIERIVAWSIARRGAVLVTTLLLVCVAAIVSRRVELDALPDVTTNQVLVLTRAPGMTPEEVERTVTRPLELALGGMPGLVEHRSLSRYGISSITVVFEDGVPPLVARSQVAERIAAVGAQLPTGAGPPELGPLTGGLGEVFHFSISSTHRAPSELLELASTRVAPLLRGSPGVVEVNTWGGARRTLEVRARPIDLAQRGLLLDDLHGALERATGAAPGASLQAGSGQALLRAMARPTRPADLAAAVVRADTDGGVVRVADVADVGVGALPRLGAATANGDGEVVYVMAQMLRGANALDVTSGLRQRIPAVRAALPPDVRLTMVYDRSELVGATLRTVGMSLAEGGLLVVVVLFAMLGSFRAGLVVASAIPLSMLGASTGMVGFGIAGNLMSLGAIDFGLVVDGAVVIVEQVFHDARAHGLAAEPAERRASITRSATRVARPMFFSVLVIVLVYAPVLSLSGVDGKLFRPMAATVLLALVTSLLLALTYVPAVASWVIRPRDVPARDPLFVRLVERLYPPMLYRVAARPRLVASLGAAGLALGAVLFVQSGSELTPQLEEGDLVIQTTRAADIAMGTAVTDARAFERAVRAVPEVRDVVSRIGSPAVATDIMGVEQADVFVRLAPRAEWRRGTDKESLVREIEAAIASADPASDPSFTQPIQMRFNELLGGAVTDVAVSLYGDDLSKLHVLADDVARVLDDVPGAADVRVQAPDDVPLVEIVPRPLEASRAGLSAADILQAVQAIQQGVEVGTTYDGAVAVPIVLRLDGARTAFDLSRLALPVRGGGLVPLRSVAEVVTSDAPSLVSHQDGARRLVVGFNVRGRDLGALVQDARSRVAAAVTFPEGYRPAWGGQYEAFEEASARLRLVVPAALLLVVGALYLAFRKLRPVVIILSHVPFAGIGGIAALWLRGMAVSMPAAIGFLALSGVAVLNGVVYLSRALELEAAGDAPLTAALGAARSRVRPVLMTALVASLGFVPMAISTGVGAEVQRPLATVVVGGLGTSTLLTLFVLPALYPWLSRIRSTRRRSEAILAT